MKQRFIALFLVVLMCASTIVDTASAAKETDNFYDENFFSLNNIGWFDPRCGDATSAKYVQLAGKDNTEKILNFFMRKGLTLAQSAGIVGNMIQESGLNPAIIQGGKIADDRYVLQSGVGFGLIQWTSGGRQQNFMKFMKELGVGVTDLSGQLEFVWKEMNDSYPKTVRALKAANNPVDAAIAVHGPPSPGYEASADSPEKVRTVRGGNAQKVHDKYADEPALAGSTADKMMTPAGEGSEADATAMAAKTDEKKSCVGTSDSGSASEKFGKLVLDYAWHEYTAGRQDMQPAYVDAVARADKEDRYYGGAGGRDCGGFVTTLVHDSGLDTNYNSKKDGAKGNTITQEIWLKKHWQRLSKEDEAKDSPETRKAGDVAINEDHTYIYVGDSAGPEFKSKIASASYSDRAPMAGKEGVVDSSFRWYRKK